MQNIKNVVEAIGTDIGNINRNYQSLTARLQELESRQATPPEAVGDDGKAAAPSGLVELKYSYAKPDYLRGQHIRKQLRLPIPEAYRGKFAIFESNLIKLETDDEGYYRHWDINLADEGSVSLWVPHGAPVVQNALQVDFSVETAEKMKAYKLDNYLTAEDKALFPFNAAQFVKNNYSSWYDMFERLPRGEGLAENGGESDSESLQYFIGRYYERLKPNLDAAIENIHSAKYYVDEEYYAWSDAVNRTDNEAWQAITESDWNEVHSEETFRAMIDRYKNSEPLWREFLPKYTEIRNRLMQELKDRREAQHGEEIRKLVAAGAVLVDG